MLVYLKSIVVLSLKLQGVIGNNRSFSPVDDATINKNRYISTTFLAKSVPISSNHGPALRGSSTGQWCKRCLTLYNVTLGYVNWVFGKTHQF